MANGDNIKHREMANNVANRLDQFSGETQAASHLIATAAFQIGFVRLAVGMAVWSFEPDGLEEMKRRLAREQFDVLQLAPIDYASRTALTCLDLCAAAAYRLRKFGADRSLSNGHESDLERLRQAVRDHRVELHPHEERWRSTLMGSDDLRILRLTRAAVTHRSIGSHAWVGSDAPTTKIQIDGALYDGASLTSRFAQLAENQYEAFARAVLADFPI